MVRGEKIIVALDVSTPEEVRILIDKLRPVIKIFKVGSELFTSCGVEAIDIVRRKGCRAFLDLKFHDIPNTVKKAAKAATKRGVYMLTIHALGGLKMMREAVEGSREEAARLHVEAPILLGVTVLTSLDQTDLASIGVKGTVKNEVVRLAQLAQEAGLNGIVASPNEVSEIRARVKKDFIIVTPGVRPKWCLKSDQKRVATPKEALSRGSDYLVIGRPITASDDPREAAEKILEEIE